MHSRANTDLYARNQYDEIGRRGAFPHRKSKSAGLFDKLRNTGRQTIPITSRISTCTKEKEIIKGEGF